MGVVLVLCVGGMGIYGSLWIVRIGGEYGGGISIFVTFEFLCVLTLSWIYSYYFHDAQHAQKQ